MILNFGVEEMAYPEEIAPNGKVARAAKSTSAVAEELEARYGVMYAFFLLHEEEITALLNRDIARSIADYWQQGGDFKVRISQESLQEIEDMFRLFLDNEEIVGLGVYGVPTHAALKEGRPSFIDTGLYQECFRAWIGGSDGGG